MRVKSEIPWLDHTFQAEDILRDAGRAAIRLSSAFSETGNETVADKVEGIAAAIDRALGHLREAHLARNTEISAHMAEGIGSTLNALIRMTENPAAQ